MLCWFLVYSNVIQLERERGRERAGRERVLQGIRVPCALRGSLLLSVLHIRARICEPHTPKLFLPSSPLAATVCSLCLSVCFCFIDKFTCQI